MTSLNQVFLAPFGVGRWSNLGTRLLNHLNSWLQRVEIPSLPSAIHLNFWSSKMLNYTSLLISVHVQASFEGSKIPSWSRETFSCRPILVGLIFLSSLRRTWDNLFANKPQCKHTECRFRAWFGSLTWRYPVGYVDVIRFDIYSNCCKDFWEKLQSLEGIFEWSQLGYTNKFEIVGVDYNFQVYYYYYSSQVYYCSLLQIT